MPMEHLIINLERRRKMRIMEMKRATVPDALIRQALQPAMESGIELLLQLGACDLWRGDLSEMRGDVPSARVRTTEPPASHEQTAQAAHLYDTLVLKQAIERLSPACREVLHRVYAEGRGIRAVAQELETTASSVKTLVENCRLRLSEIASRIKADSGTDETASN